jgi:hypothetical protein
MLTINKVDDYPELAMPFLIRLAIIFGVLVIIGAIAGYTLRAIDWTRAKWRIWRNSRST